MTNVIFLDVEYANPKTKSICQIGIICEDFSTGDSNHPRFNIYVNPEDAFDKGCVEVHGITSDKVKNAPNFPSVWANIEKYFTKSVVIGHNVSDYDLDVIVKNLKRYNLDIPEFYYICLMDLAKKHIPSYCVPDYSLATLCKYFDIEIGTEHNAYDDAYACSELFKAILDEYGITPAPVKYKLKDLKQHFTYSDESIIRKAISEFYGIIHGISIDNEISEGELEIISDWKRTNQKYDDHLTVSSIIDLINIVLSDGVLTKAEIKAIEKTISAYLEETSTSRITLSTQILNGILKGITADGKISEDECKSLHRWLYENSFLSEHFAFNKTLSIVDKIIKDNIVTPEELDKLTSTVNELLYPIEAIKKQQDSEKATNTDV